MLHGEEIASKGGVRREMQDPGERQSLKPQQLRREAVELHQVAGHCVDMHVVKIDAANEGRTAGGDVARAQVHLAFGRGPNVRPSRRAKVRAEVLCMRNNGDAIPLRNVNLEPRTKGIHNGRGEAPQHDKGTLARFEVQASSITSGAISNMQRQTGCDVADRRANIVSASTNNAKAGKDNRVLHQAKNRFEGNAEAERS